MCIKISIEDNRLVVTLYSVDQQGGIWEEASDSISLLDLKQALTVK